VSDPFVPASTLYDPATGKREPREWPMPIAAYAGVEAFADPVCDSWRVRR